MAYNGTPSGEDNCCEDKKTTKTKPNVIHAEINALKKIPKNTKLHHAWMFVTVSPCVECANYIIQRGVGTVVYDMMKNTNIGIPILIKNKIAVHQLSP
jgi:dCMP deaminase